MDFDSIGDKLGILSLSGGCGMTSSDGEYEDNQFPVIQINGESILEPEQLGSKQKFWFQRPIDGSVSLWLFKYTQKGTGQHWAEKIAAEIASMLGIQHAVVELAAFGGELGSATRSFARDGRELIHGNQILAGRVMGYDPIKTYRHSDHTLNNIFLALERSFMTPSGVSKAKHTLMDFVVFDSLIGNTDRHHENWGVLRRKVGDKVFARVAPSFDHASSLGRELRDVGGKASRDQILVQNQIGAYSERARGGIYIGTPDQYAPSPLALVRYAIQTFPEFCAPALMRLNSIDIGAVKSLIDRVPERCMTPMAKSFALALINYNYRKLRELSP